MWFIDLIGSTLQSIAGFFWRMSLEVGGWVWPFYLLSNPLWNVGNLCITIGQNIYRLGLWISDITEAIGNFFSWLDLEAWFASWKRMLFDVWDWFADRWDWFTSAITNWWAGVQGTVKGWIAYAVQGLDRLRSEVANFFTVILPSLVNFNALRDWWTGMFKEVAELIHSTLLEWFPFYDDLIEIWNDVVEFFCNPLDFLLDRFTDWFLGKEE